MLEEDDNVEAHEHEQEEQDVRSESEGHIRQELGGEGSPRLTYLLFAVGYTHPEGNTPE